MGCKGLHPSSGEVVGRRREGPCYPPGNMDLIVPADVQCPTCGEWLTVELDTSQGEDFETVQDCEVCCRPMLLNVRCSPGQVDSVESESA